MKQWKISSVDRKETLSLSKKLKVSPFLAQLLLHRNLGDPDKAFAFLNHSLKDLPSPWLMKDMDLAVDRLVAAIYGKQKIVVYGDYDVDGTSATSLFILFFRQLGVALDYYIPHRVKEGYALNEKAIKKLKKQGADLLITVDNGISSTSEAELAATLGLDLIITDHHEIPETLPKACAVLNPLRKDCPFPGKEICGAGVVFFLLMALRQRLREEGYFKEKKEPNLKQFLDFVALATVSDVVPLTGVNRILVKKGLQTMEHSVWPGICALKQVSQVTGKVEAVHLGFRLGPRLNACGRLYDASAGVGLLTTEKEDEAIQLAKDLDKVNQERKGLEDSILKEALEMVSKISENRMSYVLYRPHWHVGVIGIVASRLVERLARPVILLGQDGEKVKGSGRSFGRLHLVDTLRECKEYLLKFGGHKAAVGLTLRKEDLGNFSELFEEKVSKELEAKDCIFSLNVDVELTLKDIEFSLLKELQLMEPFGQGNPEPLFCLLKAQSDGERIVGKNHLKFSVIQAQLRHEAIAFGMGDREIEVKKGRMDLAFTLRENEYQGLKSLVLNVRDFRVHSK